MKDNMEADFATAPNTFREEKIVSVDRLDIKTDFQSLGFQCLSLCRGKLQTVIYTTSFTSNEQVAYTRYPGKT